MSQSASHRTAICTGNSSCRVPSSWLRMYDVTWWPKEPALKVQGEFPRRHFDATQQRGLQAGQYKTATTNRTWLTSAPSIAAEQAEACARKNAPERSVTTFKTVAAALRVAGRVRLPRTPAMLLSIEGAAMSREAHPPHDNDFLRAVLRSLEPLPVTVRRLFGGFGRYLEGAFFGVSGGRLHFRTDGQTRFDYAACGMEALQPGYRVRGPASVDRHFEVARHIKRDGTALLGVRAAGCCDAERRASPATA